jgi:O-antigen ligase
VVWVLCIRPLRDYARCRPFAENRRLADLCLMIIAFVILNSLLESSWFRRADPTWIMMILSIAGMRMACRVRF